MIRSECHRNSFAALGFLILGACTLGPDHLPPRSALPAVVTTLPAAPELSDAEPDPDWWRGFGDTILDDLVTDAVQHNADVEAAGARIEQARALRAVARGGGLPSVFANSSVTRAQGSANAIDFSGLAGGMDSGVPDGQGGGASAIGGIGEPQTIYSVGTSASWEIDLFGRVQRRVEAADARIGIAEEDRNAILLTAIADTVQNYAELRSAQVQREVAQNNLATAEQTVSLVEMLVERGLSSEFDLSRVRAELRAAEAALLPIEAQIRANNAAIAALTGRFPADLNGRLLEVKPLQPMEGAFPAGVPSYILRRRPDIRLAERRLAAETADIGGEIADLYPNFSLTGMFGFSAMSLDMLFSGGSEQFSIGAALDWPIFAGGRNRAEITEARAGADEARARYRGAVLNAFRDADRSLTRYVFATRRLDRLTAGLLERQRSFDFARLRYERGLDSLLTLLDTQRQLDAARSAEADGRAEVLAATVAAYRALGGGWEIRKTP